MFFFSWGYLKSFVYKTSILSEDPIGIIVQATARNTEILASLNEYGIHCTDICTHLSMQMGGISNIYILNI